MKINRIFKTVFLQGLLGLGLFLGACSSLNETLPETNLPEEESLEVATIRNVVITVKGRGETTTYDLDTFALRYPEKRQVMNSVLNKIVADIDTDTVQELDLDCDFASDPDGIWSITCAIGKYYCGLAVDSEEGEFVFGCGSASSESEAILNLKSQEGQDTNSMAIDWDWCRWFLPPGPYDPYPIPSPDNYCRWW